MKLSTTEIMTSSNNHGILQAERKANNERYPSGDSGLCRYHVCPNRPHHLKWLPLPFARSRGLIQGARQVTSKKKKKNLKTAIAPSSNTTQGRSSSFRTHTWTPVSCAKLSLRLSSKSCCGVHVLFLSHRCIAIGDVGFRWIGPWELAEARLE